MDEDSETLAEHYAGFYAALAQLREQLHAVGRFDDANAKLDEICKLLAFRGLDLVNNPVVQDQWLTRQRLSQVANDECAGRGLSAALPLVIAYIAKSCPDESAEICAATSLDYRAMDDAFVEAVLPVLDAMPSAERTLGDAWSFDVLNEAFGHFIQNSFRNRREDAQYMTPPEVVSAMVEMGLSDVTPGDDQRRQRVIADPTCGVGSFLAACFRRIASDHCTDGSDATWQLIGQDRVERMARLARTNLVVFAAGPAAISCGNSVLTGSPLDQWTGQIDLILTNPPFGATFASQELVGDKSREFYPVLTVLSAEGKLPERLDSEYILMDRALALLKPGGQLWIIVPDRVVSGSGFSEMFRRQLLHHARLRAVIDLPAETFAQAGTRTKTSVVCLERLAERRLGPSREPVFMSACNEIGFRVATRGGATIKQVDGTNQLVQIAELYKRNWPPMEEHSSFITIHEEPSVALVREDCLLNDRWNAHFYRSPRLRAMTDLEQLVAQKRGMAICRLDEAVRIDPEAGQRLLASEKDWCISVLHVDEVGVLQMQAVVEYRPTTACVRCLPGDVLLSRINPRIPRICVIPEFEHGFACSAEFAVLRCDDASKLTPWMLALTLRSELVQRQVRSLTSGTSSSHNRIKPRELASICLPIVKSETGAYDQLHRASEQYRQAVMSQYDAFSAITDSFERAERLYSRSPPANA